MDTTISAVNLHRIIILAAISALTTSLVLFNIQLYPMTMKIDFVVCFILVLIFVFRQRISNSQKLASLIVLGLIVGIGMFIEKPFAVDGMLVLSAAMVLSFANWYGYKIWLVPLLSITCTAVMASLIGIGYIHFDVEDYPDFNNAGVWFISFQSQLLMVIVTGFSIVELKERLHSKIRELAIKNKEISQIAFMDPITGVSNWQHLEKIIDELVQNKKPFVLFNLTCHGTKQLRALHGQQKTQECLKKISDICLKASKKRGFVAFSNGDNFFYLTENKDRKYLCNAFDNLYHALNVDPVIVKNELSFSAVATEFPLDGSSFYDLVNNLHIMSHHQSSNSEVSLKFFDGDIKEAIQKREKLRSKVKSAIIDNKFFAVYQSKIRTKDHKVVGFEGLARLDPTDGFVSPAEFIPIINDEGWMEDFSYLMLENIIKDIPMFVEKFGSNVRISANVSPPVFISTEFYSFVIDCLGKYNVSGSNLTLEITEEVFASNLEKIIEHCDYFRKVGICISLDDFGSGFSSLNYLQLVKFDEIKLDRAFANNIGTRQNSLLLMTSICQLIHQLGSKSVVEGIEEIEQYRLIESLADEVQGFYFSKPLALEIILEQSSSS